jgi:organic radical activating enzyme
MFFGIDENNGGGRFTAVEAVERARELWDKDCEGDTSDFTSVPMFIVFTGGEPSTQLDDELAAAFDAPDKYGRYTILAAETNGSKALPGRLNWVCLSPKPPIAPVNHIYNEVKVLYPLFDPLSYAHLSNVLWVQPVDMFYVTAEIDFWLWREHRAVNRLESLGVCIDFVLRNPRWRISLQTHKIIGVQ